VTFEESVTDMDINPYVMFRADVRQHRSDERNASAAALATAGAACGTTCRRLAADTLTAGRSSCLPQIAAPEFAAATTTEGRSKCLPQTIR
jgi:hypothetical protein